MAKRRRTNNYGLTGGTGDVNAQYPRGYLNTTSELPAVYGRGTKAFALPKTIMTTTTGRATVIEVLKVFCLIQNPAFFPKESIQQKQFYSVMFSTSNHGLTEIGIHQADVFAGFYGLVQEQFGQKDPPVCYALMDMECIKSWDCTDGTGHGVLVATDNFYVQLNYSGIYLWLYLHYLLTTNR